MNNIVAREILIIRLSALGDVVHTLPVAAAIKRYLPEAKITWVVESLAAPLLINNPAVDRVIIFPGKSLFNKMVPARQNMPPAVVSSSIPVSGSTPLGLVLSETIASQSASTKSEGTSSQGAESGSTKPESTKLDVSQNTPPAVHPLKALALFWRQFTSYKYDIAIDAQGLLKSALLCRLSGAKTRIGFTRMREWADKFLTDAVDVGDYFGQDQHIVDLNLKLVVKLFDVIGNNMPASWLSAQFPLPVVPETVKQTVQTWLSFTAQAKESLKNIILMPGTTWDAKIWTVDKWQELGRLLLANNNCQIIICGGKKDLSINRQLEEHLISSGKRNVLNLTGRTNLLELIALFEQAHTVFGADSGPMHLAAATGKPKVIGIFGSTPWKRNGPYGKKGHAVSLNLDCQPCFEKTCPLNTLACLNDLSAQHVYDEAMEFIEGENA